MTTEERDLFDRYKTACCFGNAQLATKWGGRINHIVPGPPTGNDGYTLCGVWWNECIENPDKPLCGRCAKKALRELEKKP